MEKRGDSINADVAAVIAGYSLLQASLSRNTAIWTTNPEPSFNQFKSQEMVWQLPHSEHFGNFDASLSETIDECFFVYTVTSNEKSTF